MSVTPEFLAESSKKGAPEPSPEKRQRQPLAPQLSGRLLAHLCFLVTQHLIDRNRLERSQRRPHIDASSSVVAGMPELRPEVSRPRKVAPARHQKEHMRTLPSSIMEAALQRVFPKRRLSECLVVLRKPSSRRGTEPGTRRLATKSACTKMALERVPRPPQWPWPRRRPHLSSLMQLNEYPKCAGRLETTSTMSKRLSMEGSFDAIALNCNVLVPKV